MTDSNTCVFRTKHSHNEAQAGEASGVTRTVQMLIRVTTSHVILAVRKARGNVMPSLTGADTSYDF